MKFTSKQLLITIAVILVITVIVGIWFYRKGKKQTTIADLPIDQPFLGGSVGSNTGTGGTSSTGISSSQVSQLADELFNEMDGLSFYRNIAPFNALLILSDTDFVRVYNAFNTKYQSLGDGTLKQWISDESGIGEFATVKNNLMSKFGRLNLI